MKEDKRQLAWINNGNFFLLHLAVLPLSKHLYAYVHFASLIECFSYCYFDLSQPWVSAL